MCPSIVQHIMMCLLTLRGESTEGIVTIESAGHVDSSNRSSVSIDANTELYYLWLHLFHA